MLRHYAMNGEPLPRNLLTPIISVRIMITDFVTALSSTPLAYMSNVVNNLCDVSISVMI